MTAVPLRVACGILVALLLAAIVFMGVPPQRVYAHDVFFLLDGGWRLAHGVVPSLDFYSPFGVFMYLPIVWGFHVVGPVTAVLPLFHAFWFAVIVIPTACLVLSDRTAHYGHILGVVLIALRCASLRPLSLVPSEFGYVSIYNGFGLAAEAAVLLLMMMEVSPWSPPRERSGVWRRSLAAGLIGGLLVLVKASNGILCLAIVGSSWLISRDRRRVIAALAGAIVPPAIVTLVWPGILGANAADLRIASGASHYFTASNVAFFAIRATRDPRVYAWLLFVALTAYVMRRRGSRGLVFHAWASLSALAVTSAMSLTHFIPPASLSRGRTELLLLAVNAAALLPLLISAVRGDASATRVSAKTASIVLGVAGLVVVVPPLLLDGVSFTGMFVATVTHDVRGLDRLPLANAQDLYFTRLAGESPAVEDGYRAKVMEAVQIVGRYVPRDACYVNFDFTDATAFLLRRAKTCRGPIAWHYENTFSAASFPSAESVFAGSTYALLPRIPGDGNPATNVTISRAYEPQLRDARLVARSKYWLLVRLASGGAR